MCRGTWTIYSAQYILILLPWRGTRDRYLILFFLLMNKNIKIVPNTFLSLITTSSVNMAWQKTCQL